MPYEDIRFSNPNKEGHFKKKQVLDGRRSLQKISQLHDLGNPEVKRAFSYWLVNFV